MQAKEARRAERTEVQERLIKEIDGREAIIFTEKHFVAELLHRDWTSRARRHLDVPVLHLMEQENCDGESGGGDGVSFSC